MSTHPTDAVLFALIKEHFDLDQRRDDTVINRSTGRFHDAQRYRDFAAAVLSLAKWGQPAQAQAQADSVLEDAMRYRWLREGNDAKHGAAWHVAVNLYGLEWDAAIDAAMNKGAIP